MSNTYGQENQTGFRHLSKIYKAIEQAALSSPWPKDPYVVFRREKGSGKDNNLPTRQALRPLRKVNSSLHDYAAQLERGSDSRWIRDRHCNNETGFRHLSRVYKAIEQAAYSDPRDTRRALNLLRGVDPSLHEIADGLDEMSETIWLKERKCTRCGLLYEPAPDADSGHCILCIMEVKKA